MKHALYRSIFLIFTFIAGSAIADDGNIDQGRYEIRQLSTGRFLDAYESSGDFSIVTREVQNDSSQRWRVVLSNNNTYTLVQEATGRFMDAYQESSDDFSAVTRPAQNNDDTQRWIIEVHGVWSRLKQRSTNNFFYPRYMDAYQNGGNDFSVVTREFQADDSQIWIFKQLAGLSGDEYSIQQLSSLRFLDAYQNIANDFSVVTRPELNNTMQRWVVRNENHTDLDGRFDDVTIQQVSNNRFVDAYHNSANDFSAVTRPVQTDNNSQLWEMTGGGYIVTIQQASNNQFVDAHENQAVDFSVVTRPAQNDDSQLWLMRNIFSNSMD